MSCVDLCEICGGRRSVGVNFDSTCTLSPPTLLNSLQRPAGARGTQIQSLHKLRHVARLKSTRTVDFHRFPLSSVTDPTRALQTCGRRNDARATAGNHSTHLHRLFASVFRLPTSTTAHDSTSSSRSASSTVPSLDTLNGSYSLIPSSTRPTDSTDFWMRSIGLKTNSRGG